jgi:hypothetical protein
MARMQGSLIVMRITLRLIVMRISAGRWQLMKKLFPVFSSPDGETHSISHYVPVSLWQKARGVHKQ